HTVDILTPVLKARVDRNKIRPEREADVVTGCGSRTDDEGGNIGGLAVLAAGFPIEVPGSTLNSQRGSSQPSLHSASQAMLAGAMDVAIACGVENMTRVPMGSGTGGFSNDVINKHNIVPQGFSAEMIAAKWELGRSELDAFSLESHRRAAKAQDAGAFTREILPFELETGLFEQDEGIRKETSMEKLGDLTPSFQPDDGVITAGNSSQISDGAAGLLLMSDKKAEELHVKPRARVIARTVV